jgi:hypothetical protein
VAHTRGTVVSDERAGGGRGRGISLTAVHVFTPYWLHDRVVHRPQDVELELQDLQRALLHRARLRSRRA